MNLLLKDFPPECLRWKLVQKLAQKEYNEFIADAAEQRAPI